MLDPRPGMTLITVHAPSHSPTLAAVARELGVDSASLDEEFGVQTLDSVKGLYAVRVLVDRLPEGFADSGEVKGPFADVPIVPLGRPKG